MSFNLNCSPDALEAIGREAEIMGVSRTEYLSRLIEHIIQMPKSLTSGTSLDELNAYSRLFSDELLHNIPVLAQEERRSIDQMLLCLIEMGIAAMQRKPICLKNTVKLGLVVPLPKKNC